MDNKTGWEHDKRTHFDEIIINYDKVRPEYPYEIFKDVYSYTEAHTSKKALEIGPGTGKATYPFLGAGYDVTAVEAGFGMADFLREKFNGYNNFKVIVSAFEDVSLEENSYDLIYAASAFHWVDAEIGCPKAFRLLKSGGVIALFRYNVIADTGNELYEEIEAAYDKYYHTYYTSKVKPARKAKENFLEASEIYYGYGFRDLKDYGFKDVLMKLYDVMRIFSADEYIAFLDTLSDHRVLPDINRAALYNEIREAIQRHGGCYKVDYVFQLYMGKKY